MKTIKLIGCVGIATATLVFSTNSLTLVDSQLVYSLSVAQESGNEAHMVSHTLATDEQYSVDFPAGYKWGSKDLGTSVTTMQINLFDSVEPRSGYKWGRTSSYEQTGSRWGRTSSYEQTGSRWGRTSSYEQTGSRWGRTSSYEQTGSRWGRTSSYEQTGSRWGRTSSYEQAGSRWGRN